jgi:hypothetical protein
MSYVPILAHGGAIPPLLLAACFSVACFVTGALMVFGKRSRLRWLGAGLILCGITTVILVMVFFDAVVRLFAHAGFNGIV